MSLYRKNIGIIGEAMAINFLKERGFELLEKNFRTKLGEIDLIVKKDNKISFIEVKTRVGLSKGKPYEAVGYWKIKHLKRASYYYLLKKNIKDCKLSIDVISIILNNDLSLNKLDFYEGVEI